MVECARGASFPRKAMRAISVGRKQGGQELEGDFPPEPLVEGEVDFAHPATPERRDELIETDLIPRVQAFHRYVRGFDARLGGQRPGRNFEGRRLDEAVVRNITAEQP